MRFYLLLSDKTAIFVSVKQPVNDITEVLRGLSAQIESMQKTIDINHKGDFYVVATKDVSHFYYRDSALSLYDFSQNNYILELSIDDCEKLLDNNMFFRVNRQCIVNINSIKK